MFFVEYLFLFWFLFPVFFTIIIIVAIVNLAKKRKEQKENEEKHFDPLTQTFDHQDPKKRHWQCKYCGKISTADKTICPSCGALRISEKQKEKEK